MKHIGDFLRNACAYTVAFLLFFYLIGLSDTVTNGDISFGRFGLVLAFGSLISLSNFLFRIRINRVYTVILHYAALLLSFVLLFVVTDVLSSNSASSFIAIVIFTVLYALIFTAVYFIKKLFYGKAEKAAALAKRKNYSQRFGGKAG